MSKTKRKWIILDYTNPDALRAEDIPYDASQSMRARFDSHLTSDDHTQYLLANGSRQLTGDWDIGDGRSILADKIRARDGDGLALYDDGGNGIFIQDGGNVGIGTDSPEFKLQINDGLKTRVMIHESSNIVGPRLVLYSSQTGSAPTLELGVATQDYGNYVLANWAYLAGNSLNEGIAILGNLNDQFPYGLFVKNGGNVGIGTNSPGEKLSIYSNSTDNDFYALGLGVASTRRWKILLGGYNQHSEYGNYPLIIQRDMGTYSGAFVIEGDSPVVVRKSGKVGIGTSNPTNLFDVNKSDGNGVFAGLGDLSQTNPLVYIGGTGSHSYLETRNNYELWIGVNNHPATNIPEIVIKTSGNVGIGTNSTHSKLTVAGHITPSTDNAYDIGTSSYRWDDIWATNGTIQTCDERDKDLISDAQLGLDFINRLRPVTFKWKDYSSEAVYETRTKQKTQLVTKTREKEIIELVDGKYVKKVITEEYQEEEPVYEEYDLYDEEGNIIGKHKVPVMEEYQEEVQPAISRTYIRKHYGLVAQEVKQVLDELGIDTEDFAPLIIDEETGKYGLRYQELIPILIKAIQELYQMINNN